MKKVILGGALAALVAIPVIAQMPERPGADRAAPMTRTALQGMIQQRFAEFDANRDGAVTRAEFDQHLAVKKAERQKMRAERRGAMFAKLDADKNGQVSKAEFLAPQDRDGKEGRGKHWGGRGGHGGPGRGMMGMGGGAKWFEMLDANKDGKVTLAEASAKPLAMFDRADANKDGTVTPEERRAARDAMRGAWQAKRG